LRTLAHTRWLVAASPSFWARHGVPRHPAELSRYPCVLFRTGYGEILRRWTFKRSGERIDVDVDGWLTCDNRVAMDAESMVRRSRTYQIGGTGAARAR
jgi:hypothetical protein